MVDSASLSEVDEDPLAHLSAVLEVEDLGDERFLGRGSEQSFDRVYGGQVAAQALLAAARTVGSDTVPISAHINFLKLGVAGEPVMYSVECLADGRSLSTRLVRATQGSRSLGVSIVSFQSTDTLHTRLDHHTIAPEALDPEGLPNRNAAMAAHFGDRLTSNMMLPSWPVDVRYVDHAVWEEETTEPANLLWMKSLVALPDDQLTHCAALLYAGDLLMHEVILFPQELRWYDLVNSKDMFGASFDYTVWFHRPFRFDDWLLHELESPAIANSRGLTTARWRGPDGEIVASASELVGIFGA